MNRPGLALSLTASLAVTMTLWPAAARADVTKAQCLAANAKGQDLRRDSKLSAAREAFRECADASCPSLLRDDCIRRLDDLEKAQPTVVFETKDGSGNDVSAVKVTVDGLPLAGRLAGTPLAVDPGEHTFTFETAGQPTVQKKLVIRESEKDRRERITLGAPETAIPQGAAPSAPQSPVVAPPPETSSGLGTQQILALVAGGVGIVGLGLGTALGLMAISKKNDAQSACPSSPCSTEDGSNKWSDAASAGNVSTVGFIVAGVGVAGAAVLWFTAPSASGEASTQVGLGPGVLRVNGTW
jgi:hypothetical protein